MDAKEELQERSFTEMSELEERSRQKKRGIVMKRKTETGIRTGRGDRKHEME